MRKFDRNPATAKEDGEFQSLPIGGYVVKITAIKDEPSKEYLAIEYDIAEGEHAGYHAETYQRAKFWGGKMNRSYGEKSQQYFDGFLTAIEKSNPGYEYDWNPLSLVGKLVGIVTREREYISTKDGSVRTGQEVAQVRTASVIRSGDFKLLPKRELSEADKAKAATTMNASAGYQEVPIGDAEIPF